MKSQTETISMNGFTANIIRSKRRKTISIQVKEEGVFIAAPQRLSVSRIEEVLVKKTKWIRSKLLSSRQMIRLKPKEYISGELFDFLGKTYPLEVEVMDKSLVELKDRRLFISLPEKYSTTDKIRESLIVWYHKQAVDIFKDKVVYYSNIIGVQPSAIEVKTYKARWGSCTIYAKVQFNWKLIMAPHHIIDYVVVHELCHILEHNHSSAFWSHVEQFCPEYRECKRWLKDNGHLLEL